MPDLALLDIHKRYTVVTRIGDGTDGDSLSGQNVNNFPAGALFYVAESNRLYALRKGIPDAVGEQNGLNVVDGIGSSAAAGRFVAVQQFATGVLSAGSAIMTGFDLSAGGHFLVGYVTPGGTQGFLRAAKTADNVVTVTSSSGSDTSTVTVLYLEDPTAV
jgi:hypothetical protein